MLIKELPKTYEAQSVEAKWYAFWETSRFFNANPHTDKPPYCIVMPPPNVTGVLHMGHALVNTLQDVLIRYKRMSGFETLWQPGTDHAGIATQTVVERHLLKTQGKRRSDFTREQFLEQVWQWKERSENTIINQLKTLGCSCDWSRLRFTMDSGNNRAVRIMFKKMYDKGLIYRGDYLVNWDPVAQTALADDEVEYEEKQSFLWTLSYPLQNRHETIQVATTRPETILGDTAVAVNPKDERYRHLIGQHVQLPLSDRHIPIISDPSVDPSFGTGAVKVTPGHDPNDYQMALRHNLPMINIMTPDGKINEKGGIFQSLSMQEARSAIEGVLKKGGFLVKKEPHTLRIGVSYRSKAIIEPYLSKQWFIKMSSFAPRLRQIVEKKETQLIPSFWENTYYHWIDNLRDWCISRQLWWGHRIPIWYHIKDPNNILCSDLEEGPEEVRQNPQDWVQDSDVLDTWVSAALWPFSALGWPDKTPELARFYPNSSLITGHDILFFWVAKMLMMGDYAQDIPPFPATFLHGLIYGKSYWRADAQGGITYVSEQERKEFDLGKPVPPDVQFRWEKMSKSKGNIIDPLEIISEYGTDAMRMALCHSATQARQIDLDRRKFEEFRHFSNKMWNGARFIFQNISDLSSQELAQGLDLTQLSLEDRWILSRLNHTLQEIIKYFNSYSFDKAAYAAYTFYWEDFCSYYLELTKPFLFGKEGSAPLRTNKQKLLVILLLQSLRMLHPMAPFITEELFQSLKANFKETVSSSNIDIYTQDALYSLNQPACMVSTYPQPQCNDIHEKAEKEFDTLRQIIYCIRNIRAEMQIPPKNAPEVYLVIPEQNPLFSWLQETKHLIKALVKVKEINITSSPPDALYSSFAMVDHLQIWVILPQELEQQEEQRLYKEKERLNDVIHKTTQQLANPQFIEKAPRQLVEKQQGALKQWEEELSQINNKLQAYKKEVP